MNESFDSKTLYIYLKIQSLKYNPFITTSCVLNKRDSKYKIQKVFDSKINLEISTYAEEQNLGIVIEKDSLFYFEESLDITAIISERLKSKRLEERYFFNFLKCIDQLMIKYHLDQKLKVKLQTK